jgi:sarcosine oxidase delta subunit
MKNKAGQILVCPYCGKEKTGEEFGCCGESRDHFEYVDAEEEEQ